MRLTSRRPWRSSSLARSWMCFVVLGAAGPPEGGLYLKPPSAGGLCDGRDHHAVGEPGAAPAVVAEDRMRDDRGRRVAQASLDHHRRPVAGKYLERGAQCRLGERVRVHADEERPGDPLRPAQLMDGLADGGDVIFVEAALERGAAMAGRAERHLVRRIRRVRLKRVIGRNQPRDVDEHREGRRLAGEGMCGHRNLPGNVAKPVSRGRRVSVFGLHERLGEGVSRAPTWRASGNPEAAWQPFRRPRCRAGRCSRAIRRRRDCPRGSGSPRR